MGIRKETFAFVDPLQVQFTLRGRDVTISPLQVRDCENVARYLDPMLPAIQAAALAMKGKTDAEKDELLAAVLFDLAGRWGANFLLAVATAARLPEDFVGELRADELVALAGVLVEVNADFFVRCGPTVKAIFDRLAAAVQDLAQQSGVTATSSTGPTPSSC